MADMRHIGDLFPYIKRLVCEALRTVDCLDQRKVDSCCLKFNKKLVNGDLIIPAFVRTCLGDVMNDDKAEYERLCQEIIECISTVQFVQYCQLMSGGHLLLTLKKADVTRAVLHNVISKADQYGKSSGENSQGVLLNASVLSSSHDKDQDHLSLDHLRTALICEHTKQLLNANRAEVKSIPGSADQTVNEFELRNNQNMQETCHLFSTSCYTSTKSNMWTGKELDENAKELYKLLKSCKYVQQSHKSAVSTDNETSYQIANNIQRCDCVCEDTFSCQDSDLNVGGIILDVEEFLKDNIQFEGLTAVGSRSKVILSTSLLKDVAKLDLAAKKATNADMMLHVTSCRRVFIQQQISNVWLVTSTSLLTRKQFYLTHGLVSLYNGTDKIQEHLDPMYLQRIREKQLRESYILKYGDKVEGPGWDMSIREMAIAAIKLEILSAAPNNEVKIDLCETSREFRQATFVLYNCARLAKLFENFEENVHKGIYPALPPVNVVDFNLLRDQAEWELTLHYVMAFPSIVRDAVPATITKSQSVTIHTNKICCFLFNLSHKFSSYYGRVHILGESRLHLFPTMFARLYLMKALQQELWLDGFVVEEYQNIQVVLQSKEFQSVADVFSLFQGFSKFCEKTKLSVLVADISEQSKALECQISNTDVK